jgi:type I restriction enzyme, S subunit
LLLSESIKANITWSGLDLTDVKSMNFDPVDFSRFKLSRGDVLLNEGSGSASEVGKSAIWRDDIEGCCFQNTVLRVRPSAVSAEYLNAYFNMSALSGGFVRQTQGVNIFHIGKDGLVRFPVPVPPVGEQRRIVAKLDRQPSCFDVNHAFATSLKVLALAAVRR